MPNVINVAEYLVNHAFIKMSKLKLNELVYYSQAWSVAILHQPLFKATLRANRHGANCPILDEYLKRHQLTFASDHIYHFSVDQESVLDGVLKSYGKSSGKSLSERTKQEYPWIQARNQKDPHNISLAEMRKYYATLVR